MRILRKETYLKMIENSVASRTFNSLLVEEDDGRRRDLLNDGEYSCALFASSLLFLHRLLPKTRTTVANLEKDLSESPLFERIAADPTGLKAGDILFWESVTYEDGSQNRHVGFAISDSQAVSTNYVEKCVIRHPIGTRIENTGGQRKIESAFRPHFERMARD